MLGNLSSQTTQPEKNENSKTKSFLPAMSTESIGSRRAYDIWSAPAPDTCHVRRVQRHRYRNDHRRLDRHRRRHSPGDDATAPP